MSNLTNYHSHCSFCDGRAPLEDFIKEAISLGFTAYGVSSHAPLPFSTRWTLEKADVPAYLEEAYKLKEKYSDQIELYVGMEIDYLDEKSNPSIDYFQELPLEYRIGSVHLLETADGFADIDVSVEKFKDLLAEKFNNNVRQIITLYFQKYMRMIASGGFDIIGHPDKMSYNASQCIPGLFEQKWYNDLMEEYYSFIAESGLILEINTKAYHKFNVFFPNQRYFPLIKRRKIPVVVNSDAHFPELINSSRIEALSALKENGIDKVMELHQGKWEERGIGLYLNQ